jgi:hypothetical protein
MVFTETKHIIVLRLCLDVIGITFLPGLQCGRWTALEQSEHTYGISALRADLCLTFPLQLDGLNSSVLLYPCDITVREPLPCCTLVSPS